MAAPFFKGALLGMSLVIPLGPQNAFILQTGARQKKWGRILPVVIMAALCDALLIVGAIYGSQWASHIIAVKTTLVWVGILFLLGFGYKLWKAEVGDVESTSLPLNLLKQLIFCATISIANPHAIVDTFVVIGSVATEYSGLEKQWFGMGCILVDCFWFTFLAVVGAFITKMKQNQSILKILNRVSAVIMFYVALDLFIHYLHHT